MKSTARSFLPILSFFAKKTSNIVKNVPILGQIAETFKEVYDIYEQTTINKKAAKIAMERCAFLADAIIQCIDNNNDTLTEQQIHGISLLYDL